MTEDIPPGLLVLHGNRLELLAEAVFEWLRRQPLPPLEEDLFLVQSNGMAEWLKTTLAVRDGICAALRIELPGQFLWRAYRRVLGRAAVPAESVLDRLPLSWHLMRLLPTLTAAEGFEALAGFLEPGGVERRLQLAVRLADLYDQYQVYRSDWLEAWAAGSDHLPPGPAQAGQPLPAGQAWQAELWRRLLAGIGAEAAAASRPKLHRRFLAALERGDGAAGAGLPRRIVLFGSSHLAPQVLDALAAVSRRAQVVLAVPDPCRFHWADIIAGREALPRAPRRHALARGVDLAAVPLEEMHAHAHPLLAAWGRQGRDFVRQLDAFDDARGLPAGSGPARVQLFDEGPGENLLEQVQAAIRDLLPLAEHPPRMVAAADRSIVFHIAHSAQRELEILHDQLLDLLAHPPGAESLQPRDVVVMVPQIDSFAPAIRSVFGQHGPADPRRIPFEIADLKEREGDALLAALEWLLRLPQQRCRQSEILDLLEAPALACRFGLLPEDLPRLAAWIADAGIRWGLDQAHRDRLGLGACGEQNTWSFGLRRLLLGYAVGDATSVPVGAGAQPAGSAPQLSAIEPCAEVGGLEAALVGQLAAVLDALARWSALAAAEAPPATWGTRLRALLDDFFVAADSRDQHLLAALHEALGLWLQACELAEFSEPVPLAVAREAWLQGLAAPASGRRFRAGGVTFCTLVPLRAIPFEVVCLLGMNDADYPRAGPRSDFDLMALPGLGRPGDRSRRDDDRQLMLDALLSARRVLYLSWSGRSVRDNSVQPPSVLVSQLRDYLQAGWQGDSLGPRTTLHPLQPFSRRYFEAGPVEAGPEPETLTVTPGDGPASAAGLPGSPRGSAGGAGPGALFTYAGEWRAAHQAPAPVTGGSPRRLSASPAGTPEQPLDLEALSRFLRQPVRDFFRSRLGVVFREAPTVEDEEVFGLDALAQQHLLAEALEAAAPRAQGIDGGASDPVADPGAEAQARAALAVARLRAAGRLPLGAAGERAAAALQLEIAPMVARWLTLQAAHPLHAGRLKLHFEHAGLSVDDRMEGLRAAAAHSAGGDAAGAIVFVECQAVRMRDPKGWRAENLVAAWARTLLACACGWQLHSRIVARDGLVSALPLPQQEAAAALESLLATWLEGRASPLPVACRTALDFLSGAADPARSYEGAGATAWARGEVEDPSLARAYPDFDALGADGRFADLAGRLYRPLLDWIAAGVSFEPHDPAGDGGENHG